MSQVDWSKAPEDATHFQPENQWLRESWIKVEHGAYWFRLKLANAWSLYDGPALHLGEIIERPVQWYGESLPPVGVICEHQGKVDDREWLEVKIIAHTIKKNHSVAVFEYDDVVAFSTFSYFRPCRTAEQIAAEERDKAINFMMGDGGVDDKEWSRMFCAALYDAGYRKQVQS